MMFVSPDTLIPDPYNPLDWNRYQYARANPIRYSDPTGHAVADDTQGGCGLPSCVINPAPVPNFVSPQPQNNLDLINSNPYYLLYLPWLIFPQNGPCLGNLGCWGGIEYAHFAIGVNKPYFDGISKVTGDISNMSGYLLDYYEEWSGLKINPKIGFGLDAYKQWADDAQREDLSFLQRASRAGVVGVEGIGVSASSQAAGSTLGKVAFTASLKPSVASGQLWLPPVAFWGGYTVGYGATNVTLSMATDLVNDRLIFPFIESYIP